MNRQRVVLLCGGASDEHDVSLASARSVLQAVGDAFDLRPVVLDRRGRVASPEEGQRALGGSPALTETLDGRETGNGESAHLDVRALGLRPGDVVFPLLHGPLGEDGSVQGLLKVMGIAHVGSGVLASAVGMDKLTMKAVFASHGLPQVPYGGLTAARWRRSRADVLRDLAHLAWPRFVKPANLGSSIGIARVDDETQLVRAVGDALRYDRRVIVEAAVVGARELEIALLGNDDPELSPVGEIVFDGAFYDYDTKYVAGRADLRIPADVPADVGERVREVARRAFAAIDAAGLARVDLFYVEATGAVYLNEINTMPGFTTTSMYPRLWEAAGVPYAELVSRLVALASEPR